MRRDREHFPGTALWRKSSHSGGDGGNGVEIADGLTGVVPVRDGKTPGRLAVIFGAPAWSSFISQVKSGS